MTNNINKSIERVQNFYFERKPGCAGKARMLVPETTIEWESLRPKG